MNAWTPEYDLNGKTWTTWFLVSCGMIGMTGNSVILNQTGTQKMTPNDSGCFQKTQSRTQKIPLDAFPYVARDDASILS